MMMLGYSLLLTLALLVSAPWWLFRMLTTDRYRDGLRQRLGSVPAALRTPTNQQTIWLHAVSVGEVLAATRLVTELEAALGDTWRIVISTTTRTGQALARERFNQGRLGTSCVFYMPLDFAFCIRPYLRALKPAALILMESELWPRLLHECQRANIPVAVANARISDRSFARAMKVRALWKHILRKPTLWLAQSEQDATRLRTLINTSPTPPQNPVILSPVLNPPPKTVILSEAHRAQSKDPETAHPAPTAQPISTSNSRPGPITNLSSRPERSAVERPAAPPAQSPTILTTGNLKYDIRAPKQSRIAELIQEVADGRLIIVAGSTVASTESKVEAEEAQVIYGWMKGAKPSNALLVLAPRHPERFEDVWQMAFNFPALKATDLIAGRRRDNAVQRDYPDGHSLDAPDIILLNTIGDLAAVYGIASIAYVGGSMFPRGGHNPLEPAQFGVPIVMGESFENFREIVESMIAADAIRIVKDEAELDLMFEKLLADKDAARALGERGRQVYESQQGATTRTITAILTMLPGATQ